MASDGAAEGSALEVIPALLGRSNKQSTAQLGCSPF